MGDGPPGFRRNFTCSAVLRIHSGENNISVTGLLPSLAGLSRPLRLYRSFVTPYRVSYNPKRQASWFGCSRFARRYSGNRICFLFLRVLRCFSSPGMPSHTLCIQVWILLHYEQWVSPFGNLGSKLAYSSPKHIGVRPVLHRLLVPRHPPCALSNLTISYFRKNHYV